MKIKNLKIFLSVFLTLLIIGSTFYVSAATGSGSVQADLLQEGSFDEDIVDESKLEYAESVLGADVSGASTAIYNGLSSCSTSIKIYSYKIPVADIAVLYNNIINDNADLFYVSGNLSYNYMTLSSGEKLVYTITPHYTMSSTEIASAKEIFDAGMNKAIAQVDDTMTDMQKALTVHDYLCDIALYAPDYATNDQDIYHSAYGIMYNGKAVCAGYALTYSYIMHQVDVECKFVVSEGMGHAWNVVKIGDYWYNVDCTWDDIEYDDTNDRGGMIHRCFLKSTTALESEIGLYHYDGTTESGIECTDTTYDDYYWNDICTRIYTIDSTMYYLDMDTSNSNKMFFYKLDSAGNVSKLYSANVAYSSYSSSGSFKDSTGTTNTVSWTTPHTRLVYINGYFYYNEGTSIISMTPNGTRKVELTGLTNYVVGIGETDNDLCYQYKPSGGTLSDEQVTHITVNSTEKSPSCIKAGKTAGSYCKNCETVFSGLETIPATGHYYQATGDIVDNKIEYQCVDCLNTATYSASEVLAQWSPNLLNTTPVYMGSDLSNYSSLIDVNNDLVINSKDYAILVKQQNEEN